MGTCYVMLGMEGKYGNLITCKQSYEMAVAHRGRACGGARARGARARARARHAALGAGRDHLQGRATLSNMPVVSWFSLAKHTLIEACPTGTTTDCSGTVGSEASHKAALFIFLLHEKVQAKTTKTSITGE